MGSCCLLTLLPGSAGDRHCVLPPYRHLFCPSRTLIYFPLYPLQSQVAPWILRDVLSFCSVSIKYYLVHCSSSPLLFHLLLVTSSEERCAGNLKVHLLAQLRFNLSFLPLPPQLLLSSASLTHHFISLFRYSLLA